MLTTLQSKATATSSGAHFTTGELTFLAACIGFVLIAGWISFFVVMAIKNEKIHDLIAQTAFLQTLVVIGFGTATTYLAICRIFPAELAATLFSGIIGYVLGSTRVAARAPSRPTSA